MMRAQVELAPAVVESLNKQATRYLHWYKVSSATIDTHHRLLPQRPG
jgi:hypothetical protein